MSALSVPYARSAAVALVVVGGYFVVRRGRGNVPTIPFVPVLAIASVVTVLVPPA